jgi:hypothetical protein
MNALMTKKFDKETMRRVDEALKRAFSMPHKPHEPLKKKATRKPTIGKGRVRIGKDRS